MTIRLQAGQHRTDTCVIADEAFRSLRWDLVKDWSGRGSASEAYTFLAALRLPALQGEGTQ
jgi:hypothetical protein